MTKNSQPRIYLAGPEVFLPAELNRQVVAAKKRILATLGMVGCDPLDTEILLPHDETPQQQAAAIYQANIQLLSSCQGCIANLSPFRGVSADSGTVFEVGYALAAGLPVTAFSVVAGHYMDRVNHRDGVDDKGFSVERFNLNDNLMIACGIIASGGQVFAGKFSAADVPLLPEQLFDESSFTSAAEALGRLLR
ncbi:MAG: nucleoside 2-deoxyribosyltransferase [Marinobacter sp.]|nr:nucleoside 2-deoxyribosyltransferase [Marinobacter sp.]